MAIDYYVNWSPDEITPVREVLELEAIEYLGGAYTRMWWSGNDTGLTLIIELSGPSSWQKLRDPVTGKVDQNYDFPPSRDTRFFEVWPTDSQVSITTRQADEYTNIVAEGFAKRIARKFKGELEAND